MAPATPVGAVWTTASGRNWRQFLGGGLFGEPKQMEWDPDSASSFTVHRDKLLSNKDWNFTTYSDARKFFFVSSNSVFRDRTGIRVEWVNFYSKFLYPKSAKYNF